MDPGARFPAASHLDPWLLPLAGRITNHSGGVAIFNVTCHHFHVRVSLGKKLHSVVGILALWLKEIEPESYFKFAPITIGLP
jgi:hypothetical protein